MMWIIIGSYYSVPNVPLIISYSLQSPRSRCRLAAWQTIGLILHKRPGLLSLSTSIRPPPTKLLRSSLKSNAGTLQPTLAVEPHNSASNSSSDPTIQQLQDLISSPVSIGI